MTKPTRAPDPRPPDASEKQPDAMPSPIVIVANPVSGRGRALAAGRALFREFERRGVPVVLRETGAPGDAGRFAREAADDTRALVSVGGDGTLNEIVNGRRGRAYPVALLPAGTANVLSRENALPREPAAVADAILAGRTRLLDLGEANGRLFVALVSVGFDAAVTRELALRRCGTASPLSYVAPAIRTLLSYPFPPLRVAVNGRSAAAGAYGVVVAKTRNYGGWFRIARSVAPDDGALEAIAFSRAGRVALLRYFAAMALGRISGARGVEYHEGVREIAIDSDSRVPWQADGDWAGDTPLAVRVLPRALPLVVPESPRP